jgi:hypothetical protein
MKRNHRFPIINEALQQKIKFKRISSGIKDLDEMLVKGFSQEAAFFMSGTGTGKRA